MSPLDLGPLSDADVAARSPLSDGFGRSVRYLRLSVTDRCDLRCTYCMAEHMTFLPKADVLRLDELEAIANAFVDMGTRKLRVTGGEPLVRKDVMNLMTRLSRRLGQGLDELTLTTNGAQLSRHAAALADMGVRRVNVSLDTLDPETFGRLTRGGDLAAVLAGIDAALAAGLAVKLNAVALKADNAQALPGLIRWAHGQGMDVTLIEAMPMGEVTADRADQYLSLTELRATLASFWTLQPLDLDTGGPARYVRVAQTGGRLGFITPISHGFCDTCNRVRLTCTGVLHTCLGREDAVDLRAALRDGGADGLQAAIRAAIAAKPRGHDFRIARNAAPAVARHMSTTGG
jgi:cyclic pyranopterin phosphate synthase